MTPTEFGQMIQTCMDTIMSYAGAALPIVLVLLAVVVGVALLGGLFKWLAHIIAG